MIGSKKLAISTLLACVAVPADAQHSHGTASLQPSPQPSDPYEYGLFQLHNFEYDSAATAFRAAQQADPGNVMAFWGEAMTYNHPLWDEQDRDAALAVLARFGATPEIRAAKARTPREKAWLGAVEVLYGDGTKPQRDLAYLAKMRELLAADPTDIDARAFAGLATLGSSHGGRQIPIYMEAAAILEEGFMTHPRHPGVLHLSYSQL